jgi:hypothetical protein
MAFRGFFSIDGVEFANSSRTSAHLGRSIPSVDAEVFGAGANCSLTKPQVGLATIPANSVEVVNGLYTPPNGSRRFGPGLIEVGQCWGPAQMCSCSITLPFDDSWTGLQDFLDDPFYRVELAPWHSVEIPESGEFAGVWVTSVSGLDSTPVERQITQLIGGGAVAGHHRDSSRTVSFEAVLIGCTNAGLQYGLNWLTCQLRETVRPTGGVLRYLNAHPGYSQVDPETLWRELRNVVLTQAPQVKDARVGGSTQHRQATMYRVSWEMAATSPYAYLPSIDVPVEWSEITYKPVNWVHAADCEKPESCSDMPVLFSTECVPEEIRVIAQPPPVCGGCLPVGGLVSHTFLVPTQEWPFTCRDTAVTSVIRNTSDSPLNLQAYWRLCSSDIRCEDNRYPLQVSGLAPGAELTLDGITGRFWAWHDGRIRRPVGVVGTPNGAPWRPPLIDRQECWTFVVQTAEGAEFEAELTLHDREP